MENAVKCPNCNSYRIFGLRIDSDWAYGCGNYSPKNNNELYTEKELKYDPTDRPDIDICHCLNCHILFEE